MTLQPVTLINKGLKEVLVKRPVNQEIYTNPEARGSNEFLFFIKPELTLPGAGIKFEEILQMILAKIEEFNLSIKNIRTINAAYLQKHHIISKHYGVINQLSSSINDHISEEAKEKFHEIYTIPFEDAEVLGSIEMIQKYAYFTPTALSVLWQNSPTEKLAGGTYSQKLTVNGSEVFLVNGFHPRQLEHFVKDGRSIITMTLVGNTNWQTARNNFIGKTNPADAVEGSIRNNLLINKQAYNLAEISSSWNGVHLSAGPVEGLVELMRYNANLEIGKLDLIDNYSFGNQLIDEFDNDVIDKILGNPNVMVDGKSISIFDLTEEMDSEDCMNQLKDLDL